MATTDTEVQNLIVNKLTYAQWKAAKAAGTLSETETYEFTDTDTALQEKLVSGINIKTINNSSILGSGNISASSLPAQAGQSGKFLTTDGTDASWADVAGVLPSQSGQSGKYLITNGSTASWSDVMGTVETSLKTVNGNSLIGTGDITITSAPDLDETTINLNNDNKLQAIGIIEKNAGAVKYDWVGTLAQWTAGRSGGTIPDSWICYITDDETTSVSVDWSSLVNVPTYVTAPDNKSITISSSDQVQSIGVIDQNNTSIALKSWSGTLAQYNALKEQPSYYAWVDNYDALFFTTSLTPSVGDTVYFGANKEDTGYFKVYSFNNGNLVIENVGASYFSVTRDSSQDEIGQASQIDNNTLYNITDDTDLSLSILATLYPVGAIYIGTMDTCPLSVLGLGTWVKISEGRVLQGSDSGHNAGTTIEAGLPDHTHTVPAPSQYTGSGSGYSQWYGQGTNTFTSSAASDSNPIYGNSDTVQPPAYVVNIWKRVA